MSVELKFDLKKKRRMESMPLGLHERGFPNLERPIRIKGKNKSLSLEQQEDLGEEYLDVVSPITLPARHNTSRSGSKHYEKVMDILSNDKELEGYISEHKELLKTLQNIPTLNTEQMLSIISAAEREVRTGL